MAESERRSKIHVGFDAALVLLGLPLAMLSLFPALPPSQWLSTQLLIAQAISFPIVLGVIIIVVGLIFAAARLFGAAVLALLTALGLIVNPAPPLFVERAPAGEKTLSVTTFNTLETLTPAGLQELIGEHDSDVIVLPEASKKRVEAAVAGTAYEGNVVSSTDEVGVNATTVIVHSRLGTIEPVAGLETTLGAVTVRPSKLDVTIVGLHTMPPVPTAQRTWRADLERIDDYARSTQDFTIIAGDFNANLRHGPMTDLGAFWDTARLCSRYPSGTWPTDGLLGLRTHIDHVLVNRMVQVESCQVRSVDRSDHLAYTTRFRY